MISPADRPTAPPLSRRRLLGCLGCAAISACARPDPADPKRGGDSPADSTPGTRDSARDSARDTSPDTEIPACDDGRSVEGWVELPLSVYPELAAPGGYAYVEVPDRLLQAIVAHTEPGCVVALWRICSHGACEVEWDSVARAAVCPCHGSVFAEDGAILEGPATVPLRAFPAILRDGSVWVDR